LTFFKDKYSNCKNNKKLRVISEFLLINFN
jgi:hypothetical protein